MVAFSTLFKLLALRAILRAVTNRGAASITSTTKRHLAYKPVDHRKKNGFGSLAGVMFPRLNTSKPTTLKPWTEPWLKTRNPERLTLATLPLTTLATLALGVLATLALTTLPVVLVLILVV
jgi:hypothetical protein